MPRTTRNSTKKIPIFATLPTLANSASTSRRMPLTTKKNGMKKPNATAVSFESNSGTSRARRVCRVIRPAANPPRSRSSPRSDASSASANTSTTIHRTASCELRLDRPLEHRDGPLGRAHGEHGDAHRERDERDEDERVVQRALGREHQREQEDRPELADRPGRQQVAAEVRLQLARVLEDGDQRADRGRRQRGADIDERHDDAEGRQDAAERVGDHERERPARQPQLQRLPPDALDVDLVAGEEEQHPEPEIAEELRERVHAGEVQQLRPDQHAERELDDHHGEEQAARRLRRRTASPRSRPSRRSPGTIRRLRRKPGSSQRTHGLAVRSGGDAHASRAARRPRPSSG